MVCLLLLATMAKPCAVLRILRMIRALLLAVILLTFLCMLSVGLIRIMALYSRAPLRSLPRLLSSQRRTPLANISPKFLTSAAFRATPPGCGKRFNQDKRRRVPKYLDPCSFRFALGYCLFLISVVDLRKMEKELNKYACL